MSMSLKSEKDNVITEKKVKRIKPAPIVAVDLFCGVGGLTNGLEQAGINVLAGFDFEPSVAYAYDKNNKSKFIQQDITKLESSVIKKMFEGAERTLIAGCAPCQPFSSYQKEKAIEVRRTHYKYQAFMHFIRIVEDVQPDYVTMENVRGILKDENFTQFVADLKDMGYEVTPEVVNIARFGAPQNRNRMLLIASKHEELHLPKKLVDKPVTVAEAIGHLPSLKAGGVNKKDPLHRSSGLSELNIKRIKASSAGGTWKEWDEELLPNCYRKPSGATFTSVYGRLSSDKPSNTLTTQFTRYGTGRYGHYKQNRALSLREGALIQTFPEYYDFDVKNNGTTKVAMHIGNAVPPLAGKVIGKTFMEAK